MKKEHIDIKKVIDSTLNVERVQYLTEIFPTIPSNKILNKVITGIGATYSELIADRNSIIIEPTVPVIKGKIKEHKNAMGVYEGKTVDDVIEYLCKRQKRHKFITTPESFWKIKEGMEEMEIDMYSNYFLLFDECERIVQDIAYRSDIILPMDDFFQFENKALVSATPRISEDPRFEEKGFEIIELRPQFPIKEDITLYSTNCILDTLREVICGCGDKICLFFNSTDSIHAVIKQLGIENDSAVFCSKKSVDKLKSRDYKTTYETWNLERMKRFNFFTSRFYAALDIKLPFKPDVIILTDLYYAEHSMVDPDTEAVQIKGRFRNGINSLTHITNTNSNYVIRSQDEIKGYLNGCEDVFNKFMSLYRYAASRNMSDMLGEAIKVIPYYNLLFPDGSKNYSAIANFVDEALVKSYYHNEESILAAYEKCRYFNVTHRKKYLPLGDFEKLKRERSTSLKERHKEIVRQLELLQGYESGITRTLVNDLKNSDPFIVEAYLAIGKEEIERLKYSRPRIKEAMILKQYEERTTGTEFIQMVDLHFEVCRKYTLKYIKEKLNYIFKTLEITPRETVTSESISDFFNTQPYRSGNNKGYLLISKK
ncbi:hypothetical protein D0T51_12260 [Parabacteroides sp. 52]|uniref:hypothetical protein n=1 Tax=unclassified Parabacteroides TaxID=2649774 RepID=UPI0013D89631|nr:MULTISPECIES: hypothetical protein [unclassified Parabacteroides]NDV56491.1 hypothetical protein [Parabacteroides sp. 52]